ncbi:unnamed protein product [Musa acuminata subsp. burmannicoides]
MLKASPSPIARQISNTYHCLVPEMTSRIPREEHTILLENPGINALTK